MIKLTFLYNAVIDLLFPKKCELCNKIISTHQFPLCYQCIVAISKTNFKHVEKNPLKNKLYDISNLKYCIGLFNYQKESKTQELIHKLKYQSKKNIGLFFASELARKIKNERIQFDFLIAIPMYKRKQKKRGYNQTDIITDSLSEKIGVPVLHIIEKHIDTESQTKKTNYQRWKNQEKKFRLCDSYNIKGKHLLIIDDVITTGATMHSCLKLFEDEDVIVSVACIAYS